MSTLCFNHSKPLLPDISGANYREELPDGRCTCGQTWNLPDFEIALALYAGITDYDARCKWYDVRTGFQKKPRTKSVKDTAEDVSARWYLITLTQPDTIQEPTYIIKNTMKIIKSKMVSPISWCYCLELTEKGIPHSHIILYTEKYFDYAKIKKFNASPQGLPWITDIQQEKWNVKAYPQKKRTKPSAEWLATYGLDRCVWYSDNFPEELKPTDYI